MRIPYRRLKGVWVDSKVEIIYGLKLAWSTVLLFMAAIYTSVVLDEVATQGDVAFGVLCLWVLDGWKWERP